MGCLAHVGEEEEKCDAEHENRDNVVPEALLVNALEFDKAEVKLARVGHGDEDNGEDQREAPADDVVGETKAFLVNGLLLKACGG